MLGYGDLTPKQQFTKVLRDPYWTTTPEGLDTNHGCRQRALQGERSAEPKKKAPELSVVTVVLKNVFVQVSLQQQASGRGRVIVEFKDSVTRDEVIAAIKSVVDEKKKGGPDTPFRSLAIHPAARFVTQARVSRGNMLAADTADV